MPVAVRPAAANANESRPSPQPMSMTVRGRSARALTSSKKVEPLVYDVRA